jgi:hypothetical protein
MKPALLRTGWALTIAAVSWGCAAPRILGKTTIVDQPAAGGGAAAAAETPAAGVTVNFINLSGAIDESFISVVSDAQGKYTSPELLPGKYTVEAMLPGYVIGRTSVVLGKHGKKKAPFALKKIGETKGKSQRESESDNIPTPGEVKIHPPD